MMNIDLNAIETLFTNAINELVKLAETYLPNLLMALLILIIGWIFALFISSVIAWLVGKSKLDEFLVKSLGEEDSKADITGFVKNISFYILMVIVLISSFQSLGLTLITGPLNKLLDEVYLYLPRILGAAGLLLIAWLIASVVKHLLSEIFTRTKLDQKLLIGEKKSSVGESLAETIYWLILLLVLPIVLNTLGLIDVLGPLNNMFGEVLGYLPNIFSAGIIFFVGMLIARVLQRIVSNLFESAGTDHVLNTVGLSAILGKTKLSEVIGLVVYVLILFPVLISSLDALSLKVIVEPATNMLNQIFEAIPMFFAALIMLAIAYFVGRTAASLVENLLRSVGLDRLTEMLGLKEDGNRKFTPSGVIANITMITIILFASMEAFNMIGLSSISNLLQQFLVFAGQMLMGIVILIVGLILANIAGEAIHSTVTVQPHLLALAARVAIIVLTGAMGLREMGFANEIIHLAFGTLFGAVGIAVALAFGLGCKDIASKEMGKFLDNIKK